MMFCFAFFLAILMRHYLDTHPLRDKRQASEAVDDQWGADRITFQRDGGAVMVSNNGSH